MAWAIPQQGSHLAPVFGYERQGRLYEPNQKITWKEVNKLKAWTYCPFISTLIGLLVLLDDSSAFQDGDKGTRRTPAEITRAVIALVPGINLILLIIDAVAFLYQEIRHAMDSRRVRERNVDLSGNQGQFASEFDKSFAEN